jgi:hypothetical protein
MWVGACTVYFELVYLYLSRSTCDPVRSGLVPRSLPPFLSRVSNRTKFIAMTQLYEWLLEEIEKQSATFADTQQEMLSHQRKAFQTWQDLLQEAEESLNKRSKQRRSERIRARNLLVDIHSDIGPEAFLLCAIATSISRWATISPEVIIPKLRAWWQTALRPKGLTTIATSLCSSVHILRKKIIGSNTIEDLSKPTLLDSIKLTFCQKSRCTVQPS